MSSALAQWRADIAFDPEMLARMGAAFDKTVAGIRCDDQLLMRDELAAEIIALAGRGVSDAGQLHERALAFVTARQRWSARADPNAPASANHAPQRSRRGWSMSAHPPYRLCPLCGVSMIGRKSDPRCNCDDTFECPLCHTVVTSVLRTRDDEAEPPCP